MRYFIQGILLEILMAASAWCRLHLHMHLAQQFIQHRWRSGSRHGLHSPFVYRLVDECVYAHQPKAPRGIASHFRALKHREGVLQGEDLGKGKITSRSIGDYARTSSMPDFQAELMHRLSAFLAPKRVLELGSNLGKSLCYAAAGSPSSSFTGVDGNAALVKQAHSSLAELDIHNAEVVHASFDDFLQQSEETFDWVFIDGDHRFEPTLRYFQLLKSKLNREGVLIFHDIYHSPEMMNAWNSIKKDRDVQVTLDLFFFGLVWLDLPQAKEHFSIRFPRSLFGLL
jgi:predicted O-methyltransferase YrrM